MYKPYGIIPPLITPFDAQGHVDFAAMARMAVFLVDGGVHGLFPFGTTGEFYALDDDEYVKGLETVRDAVADKTTRSGRPIQLLAGCSHITTREVIRLIKLVEQVGGYDAVSVLTPMFISQTQEELYTHYRTIASTTMDQMVIYTQVLHRNWIGISADMPNIPLDYPGVSLVPFDLEEFPWQLSFIAAKSRAFSARDYLVQDAFVRLFA